MAKKPASRKSPSKSPASASKGTAKGGGRTPPARRGRLRAVLKWTATLAVWGVIALIGVLGWYATDLPGLDDALKATRRPTVVILDAGGGTLYRAGDLYGYPVTLKGLPKALPEAVLATEDRRFYDHFGIDLIGLARAMARNVMAGGIVQGGSTITQQVAKNLFLTPARTLKRKVQEVMLALWLESRFTKDQILTLYLNRVYLGAGTYGVDAAARRYFGKTAAHLTTYESAVIAGLLKAPSRYNPIASPERARDRAAVVIANMVAAGYLTEARAAKVKTSAARAFHRRETGGRARYFVDWVLDRLPDYVSTGGRDLVVRTTLDPKLQALAEKAVQGALAGEGGKARAGQGALVAMTPDGAVRALVGGGDYGESQFNRAYQARRQPGSAFKPVVYLTALEAGMTPATVMRDAPVTIGKWQPENFSGRYEGPVRLDYALAHSINTVAARLAHKLGPKRIAKTARRLGIASPLPKDASLALGTGDVSLLELTSVFAVFANGGLGVWPHAITDIRDAAGGVIYQRKGSGPGRVADADKVATLTAMLAKVIAEGTGRNARIGRPAAGKTGTSQNFRDAWFVGYTPGLVAGVWFGNDDGAPMKHVTGGGLPARTWRRFMSGALKGAPVRQFAKPGWFSRLFGGGGPAKDGTAGGGAAPAQSMEEGG